MWAQMKDITSTLKVFANLKKNLAELQNGDTFYYSVLAKHGVEHANGFKSTKPARAAAREMLEAINAANAPDAPDPNDDKDPGRDTL
jgi:hypothetical protein